MELKQYKEAFYVTKKTYELDPHELGAIQVYAHNLWVLGQPDEAKKIILKGLTFAPDSPLLRMEYGSVLIITNKIGRAHV